MYEKIKQLSIDVKDEEKYVDELFNKHDPYENFNNESVYLQGAEDMLGVLSHKRLRNIKIRNDIPPGILKVLRNSIMDIGYVVF